MCKCCGNVRPIRPPINLNNQSDVYNYKVRSKSYINYVMAMLKIYAPVFIFKFLAAEGRCKKNNNVVGVAT